MNYLFYNSKNLKQINISNFNTQNLEIIDSMFRETGLESLDLSNLNTSKVKI